MAINVSATPIPISVTLKPGLMVHSPPAPRDPNLDKDFTYFALDGRFNPTVEVTLNGTWLNVGVIAEPIPIIISILGNESMGVTILSGLIDLTLTIGQSEIATTSAFITGPQFTTEPGGGKRNWVKWSRIGSADFTIWKDNIAGEAPMDWKGWVYDIRKLVNTSTVAPLSADRTKAVVYGKNGITLLSPHDNVFGPKVIQRGGLWSQQAVTGNDFVHFFIDSKGVMWQLDEKLQMLGYKEFFSSMSSIVMSYDELNQLVYICDGTVGYVYSIADMSLGRGPANITSIGVRDGEVVYGAPAAIAIPPFSYCSDIYDMNTRKPKTISSVEWAINAVQNLWSAIDYRLNKEDAFKSTKWAYVNPSGKAVIPCYGTEFRFRLKGITYEDFKLDAFRVNGTVHQWSYVDSFGLR